MTKIVAISGSLRKGSLNTALLKAAQAFLPSNYNIELVSITDIPLYNEDVEKSKGIPKAVSILKDKIADSSGLLISTPEYNNGLPGVLKNAIDWLTRPPRDISRVFHNRKVGIMGASKGRMGTVLSQTALLPIIRSLKMNPYFGKMLFVSSANTLFNEKLELVDDDAITRLKDYVVGFCDFIGV